MRRYRELRTYAAALILFGCALALAFEARTQEPKPIGILLAAGDIVTCPKGSKDTIRSGKATADLVQAQIKKANELYPGVEVRVIALGDLSYPSGESFKCFDKTWGKFKDKILPVPGNHDYVTESGAAYFTYFASTLKSVKADKDLGTYVVEFPSKLDPGQKAWRLFALNTHRSWGEGGKQVKWLETELAKSKGKQCVLAFAHVFFYSSGRHGHDDGTGEPQNSEILLDKPLLTGKQMRAMFPLLHANRASVFLAGHDHHYEQLGRANALGDPADKGSAAIADDGVRSFVVGTGGKRLYSDDYQDKWEFSEAIGLKSYGILKLELFPSSYKWEFIPHNDPGSVQVKKSVSSDNCNLAP